MDAVLSSPQDALAPHQALIRRLLRAGAWVVVLAVLPAAAWVTLAPLSSAVVAPAVVKVDQNRRPVQHAEGGTVRAVKVRDGQKVAEGETLVVLGDVSVDADMTRWGKRVQAERASLARLEAEQAMALAVDFGPELGAAARGDAELAQLMAKERALFAARRDALQSQLELLRRQRQQVVREQETLKAQIEGARQSLALQKVELDNHRGLLKEGFVSANKVVQLEAQVADYGVKLEERQAEQARAEQRLLDIDLRAKAAESEYRQQASDGLKVTLARLAEIQQEQRKTRDASSRQLIVAPVAGEVIGLTATSPGTVIAPRQTVAEIVPDKTVLVVEAMVRPEDVQAVWKGQSADIRFTAFTYRSTQLVTGEVIYVSGDRLTDRRTDAPYYQVQVAVNAASLAQAGDLPLQAGMPAEVYLRGQERTPLQYLLEPLLQFGRRAARER